MENASPIRLSYSLQLANRHQRLFVFPHLTDGAETLSEPELKAIRSRLHALDTAICNEILSGSIFGALTDAQLARLIPLLAQRKTRIDGERLLLSDLQLQPRLRTEQKEHGVLSLQLCFVNPANVWWTLSEGRAILGPQGYYIKDGRAFLIASPESWAFAPLTKSGPTLEVSPNQLRPQERDLWVREWTKAGIPEEDVAFLAIKRGPPTEFIVQLSAQPHPETSAPMAVAELFARYDDQIFTIDGAKPLSAYAMHDNVTVATERDIVTEEYARQVLREIGFRYDRNTQHYVAYDEDALRCIDTEHSPFPKHWNIQRSGNLGVFRPDLHLNTRLQLLEDRGLIDVQVSVDSLNDDDIVQNLIGMKELLSWLQTGKRYIQLADGSFVAPSESFKTQLRILSDLGADSGRVLVSPLCMGLLRAMGDQHGLQLADEATQAWMEELTGNQGPLPCDVPKTLNAELRDYQKRGLDWLMMLHRHRLTGVLADDMGLGKTLQTISLLLSVQEKEGKKPSLVVAPTSVVGVWRDEAARFAPSLNVQLWYGPPELRHAVDPNHVDVLVTTYGVLRRDADMLSQIPFRYVILDEAQSAKNASSHNAKSIRRLQSERRLALTGTPIENRPEELWATFDFLAPGFLGTLKQFRKRYANNIARGDADSTLLLRMRLAPLVLRRMKTDVAKELPPKIETTVRCEMGPAQRALYDHIAGELRENVQKRIETVGIERAQIDILAALTRLRQICCDPALLKAPSGTKIPGSAKMALFEELMREAIESERTVIVFSQFVEMQKRIIQCVRNLGVEALWLHGGTRNREEVVAKFQDPSGPPVIVVSLRAGGTGLTLTRADTVMHFDPWWNPAVERQATDRAHRIGQTKTVTVYKLVCAQSIEERVVAMAERKEALAAELLSTENGPAPKLITREEILQLLS